MSVNLRSLVGKLNDVTRATLEAAAGLCVTRTHYDVELEHYLMKLLDSPNSDFARIVGYFRLDKSRIARDLTRSLDRLKSGNARSPALSPALLKLLTEAWTIGSIDYGMTNIRSGLTILALIANEEFTRFLPQMGEELKIIQSDTLKTHFLEVVGGSVEDDTATGNDAPEGTKSPSGSSRQPNLEQYTVNLTENARRGMIDTVLGRDFEIRQVIDILTRRRQNNPILVGEAGVGKTAVVEGFALRVAQNDVPVPLRNVTVRTLDLALLQAGAGVKGEFENRLKGLINEVKSSQAPIILFIDEAHTMIGAGGQAGQNDAANLLKPALARGELRTIAATTWSEYKRYFEKDPALARRFQVVKVEEPDEVHCGVMLRGLVPALEKHHNVRILDEGLMAAVRLSHRYLPDRQLPDKAVSVLDTSCARLALGQNATPAAIEDATREMDDLAVQERVLAREAALGADHTERLDDISRRRTDVQTRLESLQERWTHEKALVSDICELRGRIEARHSAASAAIDTGASALTTSAAAGAALAPHRPAVEEAIAEMDDMRSRLEALSKDLSVLQGELPLMRVSVDSQIVAEVVSGWTGIPVGKMLKDEISIIMKLESLLGERVIGQGHALEAISQRIRTSRANLDDASKPVGVFLLVGPSGVGKTETALALSDLLYGGERNLISINMSEFQEAHTVSTLKGSPPGYVGYGEGGVLTEAVRRRPYSVLLLDEVEKAHPDVLELFFQVFDKGQMEDGEGRRIDFKNTIIILTSNAGTDTLMKLCADPETIPGPAGLTRALKPELDKVFKPAFLGRLVIVPYFPVRDEALASIIRLKLGKVQRRLFESHRTQLVHDDTLVTEIARRCTEVESGARNIDNILTNTLLPEVSRQILSRIAEGLKPESLQVSIGPSGEFVYASM